MPVLHTRPRPERLAWGLETGQNDPMSRVKLSATAAGLPLALPATYSNHFHNTLPFDDAHSAVRKSYRLERPGSKPCVQE